MFSILCIPANYNVHFVLQYASPHSIYFTGLSWKKPWKIIYEVLQSTSLIYNWVIFYTQLRLKFDFKLRN